MGKCVVFVDLDNVYWGMTEFYALEPIDENVNLFNKIKENESKNGNEVIQIFAFADYKNVGSKKFKASLETEGITQIQVNSTTTFLERKNASDIELSITAVDYVHNNTNIDNYIIISNDSDMIPIINYLKHKKSKNVSLYVLGHGSNGDKLKNLPNDRFYKIDDQLSLTEPPTLLDKELDTILPNFINELWQKENFNRRNGNPVYPTIKSFVWNMIQFLKIDRTRRLCNKTSLQLIKYAEIKGLINISFNSSFKSDQLELIRQNDDVKKYLE